MRYGIFYSATYHRFGIRYDLREFINMLVDYYGAIFSPPHWMGASTRTRTRRITSSRMPIPIIHDIRTAEDLDSTVITTTPTPFMVICLGLFVRLCIICLGLFLKTTSDNRHCCCKHDEFLHGLIIFFLLISYWSTRFSNQSQQRKHHGEKKIPSSRRPNASTARTRNRYGFAHTMPMLNHPPAHGNKLLLSFLRQLRSNRHASSLFGNPPSHLIGHRE